MSNTSKLQKRKLTLPIFKKNLPWLFLCLPGIIYLLIFNYLPIGGIVIAFQNYNYRDGIFGSPFIGLENFKYFFASTSAGRILRNTVIYGIVFKVTSIFMSVFVALMLYELTKRIYIKMYQTAMLLPYFISWVVAAYIGYAFMSNEFGVFNKVLGLIGLNGIDWYNTVSIWPFLLVFFNIWKEIGMSCIIYYAALMGLDSSLFEAAELDGCTRMQRIRYISIPSLVPTITILLIMGMSSIIVGGSFDMFFQMPLNSPSLYPATDIISTYSYRGLLAGTFGETAALGLFQSAIGSGLILITNAIVRKVNPDNAMM